MSFSVLMSLYAKERPDFLRQSLDSVFNQTLVPDEVILVEDGPITTDLYRVVSEYSDKHPEIKMVLLPVNKGLGLALREGLTHCSNELVARMDTDDVCKPDRFEKQMAFMQSHPEIDVCGSWIDEFIGSIDNVTSQRRTAETASEIAEFARSRNPLNHPSVMFRKSAVERAGSYQHFPLFEDWYLWVRMIHNGSRLANIPESLLWFRTSPDTFKRRGGWRYAKDSAKFQMALCNLGFISTLQAIKGSVIRGTVYMLPNSLRAFIYSKLLR